jgi:murein DD-endopeptidase MepM/ murein hydrolase activator NlpD
MRRAARLSVFLLLAASCRGPAATETAPDIAPALVCHGYPDQATSPYRLPYDIGTGYLLGQGNCSLTGPTHFPSSVYKYAYDFLMPIGTRVTAARAGVVIDVERRFVDSTRIVGQENYVFIRQEDGTVARYLHFTHDGPAVSIGDHVVAGQFIGLSGDTGNSRTPHLHFDVVPCADGSYACVTIPVTFFNTRPHPDGLVEFETYVAEPVGEAVINRS